MSKDKKKTGVRVTTGVKAGGLDTLNHTRSVLKI